MRNHGGFTKYDIYVKESLQMKEKYLQSIPFLCENALIRIITTHPCPRLAFKFILIMITHLSPFV